MCLRGKFFIYLFVFLNICLRVWVFINWSVFLNICLRGEWNGPWSERSWEWDSLSERDKELLSVRWAFSFIIIMNMRCLIKFWNIIAWILGLSSVHSNVPFFQSMLMLFLQSAQWGRVLDVFRRLCQTVLTSRSRPHWSRWLDVRTSASQVLKDFFRTFSWSWRCCWRCFVGVDVFVEAE